nr:matrixin family metalloprotease [Micromonospora sp. DSM 115978]
MTAPTAPHRWLKAAAKRVAAFLALALATTLGTVVLASPARATNFGSICDADPPTICVSLANNIYHVLNWEGDQDIPGMQASHAWARDNQFNPTDLVAYTDGSDSLPDVRVWDEPYGDTIWVARVECPTNNTGTGGSHPNRWCRGQILRYNSSHPIFWADEARRRSVACHEIGHTVGLRHTTDDTSCMFNGSVYPQALNAHDRAHINNRY